MNTARYCSPLTGNEYRLRGTRLVALAQRHYPDELIALSYMGVIMSLHKCKQCGKVWFHPVRPNICPTCKTSYWDIPPKKKEVSD
jgi:hypothetical protein